MKGLCQLLETHLRNSSREAEMASTVTLMVLLGESSLPKLLGESGCVAGISFKKFFTAQEAQLKVPGFVPVPSPDSSHSSSDLF